MAQSLSRRVERLAGARCGAGPAVVFVFDAETGEPFAALMKGGGASAREPGETAEAFTARANAGAASAVFLPDNGRDGDRRR